MLLSQSIIYSLMEVSDNEWANVRSRRSSSVPCKKGVINRQGLIMRLCVPDACLDSNTCCAHDSMIHYQYCAKSYFAYQYRQSLKKIRGCVSCFHKKALTLFLSQNCRGQTELLVPRPHLLSSPTFIINQHENEVCRDHLGDVAAVLGSSQPVH